MSGFRSFLYWLAKLLGDVSAIQKGPRAIEKRVERRIVGKFTARKLWKWFK
ncbi:MAG TPA: hypothetical protein VN944_00105 [Nitrospiria bacterium]|nr:hypothetical protein [Nitrospiria bacterium]